MGRRHFTIVPIVEGHGEVKAVPRLIEDWLTSRRFLNFRVSGAIRATGCGALRATSDASDLGIEHYVRIALLRDEVDAIFVLLDSDRNCNVGADEKVGPWLKARAEAVSQGVPVGVVLAQPEFESWFLECFPVWTARGILPKNAHSKTVIKPECMASSKSRLARAKAGKYSETVEQHRLTEHLCFRRLFRRSRSFRKLLKELNSICFQARRRIPKG